jgi:demethylmenaquinone methyltransferase/2-methoxy-6-polyprenyl-1,4-benzoquinol methylase
MRSISRFGCVAGKFVRARQSVAMPARRVVSDPMRSYYDARAYEYDDWWLGEGGFAARERPGWEAEVQELVALVAALEPARVLDVACGTAFLTRHLRGDVVGLDQSATMVEIAAARLPDARVVQGDAVPLPFGDGEFDRVFTSHFYGHLLEGERAAFLTEARRVGGELVVVDSALRADGVPEDWQERALDDGTRHRVYKRWFTGDALVAELGGGEVLHDGEWFVAAVASSTS